MFSLITLELGLSSHVLGYWKTFHAPLGIFNYTDVFAKEDFQEKEG